MSRRASHFRLRRTQFADVPVLRMRRNPDLKASRFDALVSIACVESDDVVGERKSAFLDSGKDSGQKLTDLFISRYFTTV